MKIAGLNLVFKYVSEKYVKPLFPLFIFALKKGK